MRPKMFPLALAVISLTGCASLAVMSTVPLSTMSRLSSMTLAEVDPAGLRVAARLPDGLEPRPLGVKVTVAVSNGNAPAPGPDVLVLVPAGEVAEQQPLVAHRRTGARLWVYRLSAEDVTRIKRRIVEAGGSNAVSIGVGVEACRRRSFGAEPLPVTTLLRTSGTEYFVLSEDLDLRSIVSDADLSANVPACGA